MSSKAFCIKSVYEIYYFLYLVVFVTCLHILKNCYPNMGFEACRVDVMAEEEVESGLGTLRPINHAAEGF